MKQIFRLFFAFSLAAGVYAQGNLPDYLPPDSGNSIESSVHRLTSPLAGNFKDLVIDISFPDKPDNYPTINANATYPLLGTMPNGQLIQDYVQQQGGSIQADLLYEPAFEYYYTQMSGGIYNVDFVFPKKANNKCYTTTRPLSYWCSSTCTSAIINHWTEITEEVVNTLYNENPLIFNNVDCIHFSFSNVDRIFFCEDFSGTISDSHTYKITGTNTTIWTGPVSYQNALSNIVVHERCHLLGILSSEPDGFRGFPDRGEDRSIYNRAGPNIHKNLNMNDMMYHNGPVPDQQSLYGLMPLNAHDLMFLGWINQDEILEITKDNYSSFSLLKLKDVNCPLSAGEKADGYKRLIKVRISKDATSNLEEYLLLQYYSGVELSNQANFNRAYSNHDDFQAYGRGNGIYVLHVREVSSAFNRGSDVMLNPRPASLYTKNCVPPPQGDTMQYRDHARGVRHNGINSEEYSYIDDNYTIPSTIPKVNVFRYLPDGGRHVWEITNATYNEYHRWWPQPTPSATNLVWPRRNMMASDFFSDALIRGEVRNRMSDNTIPSTRAWGDYDEFSSPPEWAEFPNKTHIAVLDMTRQGQGNPATAYMSLKVKYNYWEGEISTDETMSGNVIIGSNLIVPAGKTLTILPGSHVKFANNYTSLIVNGSLQCQYNPAAGNITFDPEIATNYSGQIIFDGSASSASVLHHVTITNGAGIQCINGASPTIQNCILTRSAQGIYISNSQPSIINNTIYDPVQNGIYGTASGFSPLIQSNSIMKVTNPHNYQGIYLGASTPSILNNVISGFCNGAYIGGGCVANTGWDYNSGCNNRIIDNIIGINTGWGATTYAGLDDGTGSGNSIFGNSLYDVNTYQYSYFSAFYCYWGDAPKFEADGTSYNDISNELSSDPCGDSYKSIPSNYAQPGNTLKKSGKENILTGIKLEKQGKIDEAIAFYKKLIKRDDQAKSAFTALVTIKNKYSRLELLEYFISLLDKNNKHYGAVKKLIGDMLLQNNQFDDAIAAYNEAASNCTVAHDGIDARFEKLFAYLHKKNNTAEALQVLTELKGMHLTETEHVIRLQVAENLVNGMQYSMHKNTIAAATSIPSAYTLSQNYPNPFNPATSITYALPKAGQVTVKVYDVLGKEVACLINGYKSEGSYTVSFDASKLSSGVYVYQLRSNDIFISKKMVLAK